MKYLVHNPDNFLNSINNEINSIIHRNFDSIFPEFLFYKENDALSLPVDLKEYDDCFKVKLEVPGIKKEDINIDIQKHSLKITAKKEEETETKTKKFHKTEFRHGDFMRELYFPQEIDTEKAQAEIKDGILHICVSKKQPEEQEIKKLEIK